jgi:formylglycine-generating enzyme required for sulfatase activity/tRNA A-37 threonylcarbamoyl transferase component Bud32
MNLATCCPTEEKLRKFSSGDLPDLEFEDVFTHVQTCEPCQNRLVEVPETQDSFSESITKVSTQDLVKVRKQMELECGPDSESIASFLDRYVHRSDLPPALSPPCILGQYQIHKLIGRGGMGEVYEGFQLRLQRPVAVKILRNSRQEDAASHERFLNEMKIAGGLDHPNLVRAYDAWEADGYLYLVFELLDGQSVQNLVDAEQIKSVRDVYGIVCGVLEGLKHLHSKGLVHHDIKPGNVMRTTDGTMKLIDFGLSGNRTSKSESATKQNVNVWVGTKGFMAPEPLSVDGSEDHLRDIYSTGVLLRYLLRSVPESSPQSEKHWQERLYGVSDRMARSIPEDRHQSVCDALDALYSTTRNLAGKELRVTGFNRWSKWGGIIALSAALLITIVLGSNMLRPNKSSGIASVVPAQAAAGTSPEDIDRKIKSEAAHQVSRFASNPPSEAVSVRSLTAKPQSSSFDLSLRVVDSSFFKGIEQSLIAKLSIPELVGVPAGTFTMGGITDDQFAKPREFPNRRITIAKPFQIGKYEVTVGQYRAFVSKTDYQTVAERSEKGGWKSGKSTSWGEQSKSYTWKTPGYAISDSHPVTIIAYEDAVAYCDWLTKETGKKFRLPTEVEWEYACRAGTTGQYYFDIQTRDDHSWSVYSSGSQNNPHPVGLRFANPLGIHDIAGNVREWCLDWFAEEAYKLAFDEYPQGPNTGEFRVIRGACFFDRELFMRSSFRGFLAPDMVVNNQGFRVVCEE